MTAGTLGFTVNAGAWGGIIFSDRDPHTLTGIPEPWHLHEVL